MAKYQYNKIGVRGFADRSQSRLFGKPWTSPHINYVRGALPPHYAVLFNVKSGCADLLTAVSPDYSGNREPPRT